MAQQWTRWRKASASANQGGGCVEVARAVTWHTASASGNQGGNCVEVARVSSRIGVRDSKDRGGPVLGFTLTAWTSFLTEVREGRLTR